MPKTLIATLVSGALLATVALAGPQTPATQPSVPAQPTTNPSNPKQMLDTMLQPAPGSAKPLQPTVEVRAPDRTSGGGAAAVAPKTPPVALQREGTFIFDRVGRLTHSADGSHAEFAFEADGKTLKDPPVIILPNLKLMIMEDAVKATNLDLRFRVTGMLTEYRGRNYLLLEKVLVPPDGNSQF